MSSSSEGNGLKHVISIAAITLWMGWAFQRIWSVVSDGHVPAAYIPDSAQHLAYSDIIALYRTRFLYQHTLPYIHNRIEYPVIMGIFMWLTSLPHGLLPYFIITSVVLYAMALVTYFMLHHLVPQKAVYWAVLPLLVVYGLLNWDLLGIAFMVVAWRSYQVQHWRRSGVWFAVAVFTKLFPVFFLPFIAAELWRQGRTRQLGRMVWAFGAASVVMNVPFMIANFPNWALFYTFNAGRALGADIYSNRWIHGIPISAANLFSLLVTVIAVVWLALRVYQGGRVPEATAYAFTIFLFVNKVYSPQYTIWLMAFALLADWPVWTLLLLTLSGIADYINSFTEIHFIYTQSSALSWYTREIFNLGLLFRYSALIVAGLGARFATAPPSRYPASRL